MKLVEVINKLKRKGWTLTRVNRSHHVFTHSDFHEIVVVPHPQKDLSIGTLKAIAKSAHIAL